MCTFWQNISIYCSRIISVHVHATVFFSLKLTQCVKIYDIHYSTDVTVEVTYMANEYDLTFISDVIVDATGM